MRAPDSFFLLRTFPGDNANNQRGDQQYGCDNDYQVHGSQGNVILDLVVQLIAPGPLRIRRECLFGLSFGEFHLRPGVPCASVIVHGITSSRCTSVRRWTQPG